MSETDYMARFLSRVQVRGDGCWVFPSCDAGGYGVFWNGTRTMKAHRFHYEAIVGPVPDGYVLDHLCRTRCCVNLDHLEVVTPRENTLRGIGASAITATTNLCPRGHSMDDCYVDNRGDRACKQCHSKRHKDKYETNKDSINEAARARYKDKNDELRAAARARHAASADSRNAAARARYAAKKAKTLDV